MELNNISILEEVIKRDQILSHPDVEGKQILVSSSFFDKFIEEMEYLSGQMISTDHNQKHYYKGHELKIID